MAMSAANKKVAARQLAREIFQKLDITAHSNLDDLIAAVDSIDVAMDIVINAVPGAWETKTFKQAMIDNLPEPFKTNSTAQEKAAVLALWAMKESDVI